MALLAFGAACGSENAQETEPTKAGQGGEPEAEYVDVSPQDLETMLERGDTLLVNVHIPYAGEIGDTDLFIPYDEIGDRLEELPGGQDAKLVLYCRSGGMSAIAATALAGLGYTNVWSLAGGMAAWEAAGYPLIDARS